jgi:hypothetical protein
VTGFWLILGCMAFMLLAGSLRRRVGSAVTDVTVLVFLFALITFADLVLSRFIDTGDTAWTIAAVIAGAFALDALYGLMAPHRQKRRNRTLRSLTQRRRA